MLLASETHGEPLLTIPDYQFDAMRFYVRDCADVMGLRDWTCHYYREKPDDVDNSVMGAVSVSPTRRHFTIWLPLDWYRHANGSPNEREEARQTVAHELLHVHMNALTELPKSLQTNLGDHVWGTWWCIFRDATEILVDNLADVVAQTLPFPVIPTEPPYRHRSFDVDMV